MKKVFILSLLMGGLVGCAPKDQYTIQADLSSLEASMVYMLNTDGEAIDSAKVEKGSFEFKGLATKPSMVYITDTKTPSPIATLVQSVFLEAGDITIHDSEMPQNRRVSGTPSNDGSWQFNQAMQALSEEYRNPETTEERREALKKEYDTLIDKTISENSNNYFGVVLFAQLKAPEMSQEVLQAEIAKLSTEMQHTEMIQRVKEQAEVKARTSEGKPYIDVEQPDVKGNPISLKSVLEKEGNKYVLLDFWASWCGPCMGEVPHLKKTYDAFHKKGFEIYGVSFDKDKVKWMEAIHDKEMKWIHVSELQGFDNQAAKDYAIQGIPSNFLIECSTGKIMAIHLRGEALYNKVSELLAK